MNPVETLGLALGAGFSSGLNLYATIATPGLLQRFGVIHLPGQLQVLAHPWVLGIAIALYVVEFLAVGRRFGSPFWSSVAPLHDATPPTADARIVWTSSNVWPVSRWRAFSPV